MHAEQGDTQPSPPPSPRPQQARAGSGVMPALWLWVSFPGDATLGVPGPGHLLSALPAWWRGRFEMDLSGFLPPTGVSCQRMKEVLGGRMSPNREVMYEWKLQTTA